MQAPARDRNASSRRARRRGLPAWLAVVVISAFPATGQTAGFTPEQLPRVTPIVRAVREVGPTVVNIYQEVVDEVELPWPYRIFEPGFRSRSTSLGSGVVIDPDGFILTNSHVIQRPDREIQVRFPDGSNHQAQLINTDPGNDVALLKVTADRLLPSARIGTSSDIMVGETVLAIGNPLGNENTVTSGIVSSLFRDVRVPGPLGGNRRFRDFIQLDAAINPGNSGGPLLNLRGEVIGINWAIATEAEGIGFAIPIDRVRGSLINRLLNPQVVNEVVTGLEIAGDSTGREVALSAVRTDSPAARAGLLPGDRLVSIQGEPVQWEFDFSKALYGAEPGDRLDLVVQREGRIIPTELVLEADETPARFIHRSTGLRVADHPKYYGVVVESVDPRGNGSRAALEPGDLVDGLAGQSIDDLQDLYRTLRALPAGARVELRLFRDGRPARVWMSLR